MDTHSQGKGDLTETSSRSKLERMSLELTERQGESRFFFLFFLLISLFYLLFGTLIFIKRKGRVEIRVLIIYYRLYTYKTLTRTCTPGLDPAWVAS